MEQTSFALDNEDSANKKGQSKQPHQQSNTQGKGRISDPIKDSGPVRSDHFSALKNINKRLSDKKSIVFKIVILLMSASLLVLSLTLWLAENEQAELLSRYLNSAQQAETQLAIQSYLLTADNNELNLKAINQNLNQLQIQLDKMIELPIARQNLSEFAQRIRQALDGDEGLIRYLTKLNSSDQQVSQALALINEAKFKLKQTLAPTIERLEAYKASTEFDKLTANANRSDLFNALNQKQGEEKFDSLQASAQAYLQALEAGFYIQQLAELDSVSASVKQLHDEFTQLSRDFSDIPTKLALKKWSDWLALQPELSSESVHSTNRDRLVLKQNVNQEIDNWLQQIDSSQVLITKINQVVINDYLNRENKAIFVFMALMSLLQLLALSIYFYKKGFKWK